MKKIINKKISLSIAAIVFTIVLMTTNGCAVSEKISAKSGAQLWAENCQRCHNTPPPNTFSQEQWETVGLHMQSRALITDTERDKIVAFLKQ
jgi:hypothetical protein